MRNVFDSDLPTLQNIFMVNGMSVKRPRQEREQELYRLYLTQPGRERLAKLLKSYEDANDGIPLPDGTPLIESILIYEYPPGTP
jgi:hypothetical protein